MHGLSLGSHTGSHGCHRRTGLRGEEPSLCQGDTAYNVGSGRVALQLCRAQCAVMHGHARLRAATHGSQDGIEER